MAEEASSAGALAAPRIAVEEALLALEPGWTIRAGLRLGEAATADYLLLHARRGIALVDVDASSGDACAALRSFLERQGLATFFPGTVPIVHVVLAQARPVALAERLDAAFAEAPALTIADADWAATVRFLVAAAQAPGRPAPAQGRPAPIAEPHFAAPAWTAAPAPIVSAPAHPVASERAVVVVEPARRRWRGWAVVATTIAVLGTAGVWMALSRQTPHVATFEPAVPPADKPGDAIVATPAPVPPVALPPAATGGEAPQTGPATAAPPAPAPAPSPALVPAVTAPAAPPPPLPARKPLPSRIAVPHPVTRAAAAPPLDLVSDTPRSAVPLPARSDPRDRSDSAAARQVLP